MVGPRLTSWFESAPESAWQPVEGGLDIVVLSLKQGAVEELKQKIKINFSF